MSEVNTTAPKKNKINVVPSDKNLAYIMENKKLSPSMRQEFCNLHSTNSNLKEFLEREMEIADKAVKEFIISGNSFDFSWNEYVLRDAVIKEFDDYFAFSENLRMLGVTDSETMDKLQDILKTPNGKFMTVLLYYAAPADADSSLSAVRFIDIMGATSNYDYYNRKSFIRYSRDI